MPLEIRRAREGVLLVRASNDTVIDHYGKIITVEALHDWWEGFKQHRTVNLQHDLSELRGIRGKPQVGIATKIDFTPQLEIEVRVIDPETDRLIEERKIRSASLEFIPTQEEIRSFNGEQAGVYYRLSTEPEATGLGLVDIPGVPDTDILEIRMTQPSWAFAVVDPVVLSGEVTDPALIERLRWLPHHDLKTRMVDEAALARAVATLRDVTVPPEASLSKEQVIQRATQHLERHTRLGLGMRSIEDGASSDKEIRVNKKVKKWLIGRAAMYEAEGMGEEEAKTKAEADLKAQPQLRARLEEDDFDSFAKRSIDLNINVRTNGADEDRQEAPKDEGKDEEEEGDDGKKKPKDDPRDEAKPQEGLEERVNNAVDKRVRDILAQPENPMAAIAGGMNIRSRKLEPDEVLGEVLFRTVVKQMKREPVTSRDMEQVHNILKRNGIDTRALTLEGNGTVIYEDLARQFVVKPAPDIIGRNLFRTLPMSGTKKTDFPRFDRQGLTFQWNRSSAVGAGSMGEIVESDPTLDTFPLEVTELNGKASIPDGFLQFNASGPAFVQDYLLPELRGAAQYEEDRQFFLSTGIHPDPNTFAGMLKVVGVTIVPASANGDAFDLTILGDLLRAMPVGYRSRPDRLAFFISVPLGDDYGDELEARHTALGDRALERFVNKPGPMPVGIYRGVPVYTVPHLAQNETQGTSTDASTVTLVHLDIPVIGDALSIRIEPYRAENFITKLQLQEFVGLGYQFKEAVARRPGVRLRGA